VKLSNELFLGCDSRYEDADIAMFSAPFDGTASFRPGARFAGKAVRADSFGIETYSPYLDKDICDLSVADCGELELPFGNAERALDMIESTVSKILSDGKKPFMIGGEHLVTLGAVRAAAKVYPDLHIIHFDAHTDLRDDYLGEKLSHASVMRRCWEILGDGRIFQFGIRSGECEEFEFAKNHTVLRKFDLFEPHSHIDALKGKPVYFTLDLDVLDPAVFPGTGTPEPGGVSFMYLLNCVHLLQNFNIVGCDVCELSPPYDPSGISTAATCKIIRELLLIMSA
jgi:agmatinase